MNTIQNSGLNVSQVAERRSPNKVNFYGHFSVFSNFHPVQLEYKSMVFHSAEQLYQYQRALASGNQTLGLEIKLASDPADCKHLAKEIPDDRNRDMQIMKSVLSQKFALPKFKEALLKTGKSDILECNPHDLYWSAGIRLDDDAQAYKGKNALGKALEEIRSTVSPR